jgi:DNA repair exonuclease SbcCD ATPase subunit
MEGDSKRIEELEEKMEEDSKRIEELEEKMEEDSKRREELEEKIEGDLKKLRELEEKMNEQMNKQKLANQNFLNMKKCDGNAIELAERIREKIEKELESKFKLFEPVGFKYELKENKEYYAFKVHLGDQKYIHVFVSGEKDNIDKMEINFSIGKDLFDPL